MLSGDRKRLQLSRWLFLTVVMVYMWIPSPAHSLSPEAPSGAPAAQEGRRFSAGHADRVAATLSTKADKTAIGDEIEATLVLAARQAVAEYEVTLVGTGPAHVAGGHSLSFPGAAAGQTVSGSVRFRVSAEGQGRLRANVRARLEDGRTLTGSAELQFFTAEGTVFSGSLGLEGLKLRRLADLKAAGKLTDSEYRREVSKLWQEGTQVTGMAVESSSSGSTDV